MAGEAANTPRLIGSPAFRVWRENFGWAKDQRILAKIRLIVSLGEIAQRGQSRGRSLAVLDYDARCVAMTVESPDSRSSNPLPTLAADTSSNLACPFAANF